MELKYYKACEIYSVHERPAQEADPDNDIKARMHRPARRGILPIARSQFYELIKQNRFPAADAKQGDIPLWSGKLIQESLQGPRPD